MPHKALPSSVASVSPVSPLPSGQLWPHCHLSLLHACHPLSATQPLNVHASPSTFSTCTPVPVSSLPSRALPLHRVMTGLASAGRTSEASVSADSQLFDQWEDLMGSGSRLGKPGHSSPFLCRGQTRQASCGLSSRAPCFQDRPVTLPAYVGCSSPLASSSSRCPSSPGVLFGF